MRANFETNIEELQPEIMDNYSSILQSGFIYSFATEPINLELDFEKIDKENKNVPRYDKPLIKQKSTPNQATNQNLLAADVPTYQPNNNATPIQSINKPTPGRQISAAAPHPTLPQSQIPQQNQTSKEQQGFLDDDDNFIDDLNEDKILSDLYKQSNELSEQINNKLHNNINNDDDNEIQQLRSRRRGIWEQIEIMETQMQTSIPKRTPARESVPVLRNHSFSSSAITNHNSESNTNNIEENDNQYDSQNNSNYQNGYNNNSNYRDYDNNYDDDNNNNDYNNNNNNRSNNSYHDSYEGNDSYNENNVYNNNNNRYQNSSKSCEISSFLSDEDIEPDDDEDNVPINYASRSNSNDIIEVDDDDTEEMDDNENNEDDGQDAFPVVQPSREIEKTELDKMSEVNLKIFHHKSFRGVQASAIDAALNNKDVFVLMPTGGGKSLCYQLTGYIQGGLTIVVSPLISLIEDQVRALKELGLSAEYLSGNTTRNEYMGTINGMQNGAVTFLYVTPEKLMLSDHLFTVLTEMYQNNQITRFVVDEAHCVSSWGHDFRPQYTQLRVLKSSFPNVPIMALTATATDAVKADIIKQLGITNCQVYQQSFNRPKLFYEVVKKEGSIPKNCEFIKQWIYKYNYQNSCGLIFCMATTDTEQIAQILHENGLKAAFYHAKMSSGDRTKIQAEWTKGKVKIIVATLAFGMGIDKPDVRFVIHHTMPKSLEEYYQESGRGGRDGKPTRCILMFSMGDNNRVMRLITNPENGKKNQQRLDIERQLLTKMTEYGIDEVKCRRVSILEYFGEKFNPANCQGRCDNCERRNGGGYKVRHVDVTEHAKNIASMIFQINHKRRRAPYPTGNHIVAVYTGSKCKSVTSCGDADLEEAGRGIEFKGARQTSIHKILQILCDRKIIEEAKRILAHGPVVYWKPGKLYNTAKMRDFEPVVLDEVVESNFGPNSSSSANSSNSNSSAASKYSASESTMTENERNLYAELLQMRQSIVDERNIKNPNSVMRLEAVRQMVKERPRNVEELAALSGVGQKKAELYGDAFLRIINKETLQQSPYFSPPARTRANGSSNRANTKSRPAVQQLSQINSSPSSQQQMQMQSPQQQQQQQQMQQRRVQNRTPPPQQQQMQQMQLPLQTSPLPQQQQQNGQQQQQQQQNGQLQALQNQPDVAKLLTSINGQFSPEVLQAICAIANIVKGGGQT